MTLRDQLGDYLIGAACIVGSLVALPVIIAVAIIYTRLLFWVLQQVTS